MTKDQAIEQNRGLVHKLARRYKNSKVEFLDLVQTGYLGILDAYDHYEEEKAKGDKPFFTYAFYWVKKRIKEEAANGHLVKVPVNIQATRNKIVKAKGTYQALFGEEPDEYSLATMLETDVEDISKTIFRCDVEFFSDVDTIPVAKQPALPKVDLSTLIENLTYNETFVLTARENNLTLAEIGKRLGAVLGRKPLSRERIRQIEEQGLNRLKKRLKIKKKKALYG